MEWAIPSTQRCYSWRIGHQLGQVYLLAITLCLNEQSRRTDNLLWHPQLLRSDVYHHLHIKQVDHARITRNQYLTKHLFSRIGRIFWAKCGRYSWTLGWAGQHMAAIEETVCMVKHLKLFSTLFTCKRCQNCITFVLLTMKVCREQCKMLFTWEVLSNLAVMRETDATKATLSSERKPGIKLVCAKSISFGVSAMCVKLESITISANIIDYRQQHSLNSGLFRLCRSCLISSIDCNSSYKRQLRGI